MTTSEYLSIQATLLITLKSLTQERLSDFEAMASELARRHAQEIQDHKANSVRIADPALMASIAGAAIRFCDHSQTKGKSMGMEIGSQRSNWKRTG